MFRFPAAFMLVVAADLLLSPPAQAQSAENGQQVFKQVCSICHAAAPDKNGIGPSAFGVVGRKSASAPGFNYSDGMKNSALTWDEATLDRYLTNPRGAVPGTKMTYAGLKDDGKRRDLIAYLATLH